MLSSTIMTSSSDEIAKIHPFKTIILLFSIGGRIIQLIFIISGSRDFKETIDSPKTLGWLPRDSCGIFLMQLGEKSNILPKN